MATTRKYEINGIINTSNNVLDNLNVLASASGCFLTWDPIEGHWSVIVNEPSVPTASFNDTNIIGAINVSGSGINELYNKASIEFPNKDIRETLDYIDVTIPTADRYPGELDNVLNLKFDCINDPVQAQYIASRELKQSRVDKIIQFTSDFTANGVRAGDLIMVTADAYGFASKYFRVIEIEETDTDEGSIVFSITALEYDEDVYSTDGLTREERSKRTGIISKIENDVIEQADDVDTGATIARLLALNAAGSLFNSLFSSNEETGLITQDLKFADPTKQALMESLSIPEVNVNASPRTILCDDASDEIDIVLEYTCNGCYFNVSTFEYTYTIAGIDASLINVPLTGTVTPSYNNGTAQVARLANNQPFSIKGTGSSTADVPFTVTIQNADFNQNDTVNLTLKHVPPHISLITSDKNTIKPGETATLTLTTVGYANGETINYTISGLGSSRIATALTGSVTVSGNSATLDVAAVASFFCDGADYQSVNVNFDSAETITPCYTADNTILIGTTVDFDTNKWLNLTPDSTSITEGESVTIEIAAANFADGETISYQITGNSESLARVSIPLTGSVTVTSQNASLTVTTTDDGIDGPNFNVTVTFDGGQFNGCHGETTVSIGIFDAAQDFECDYVRVPAIWCGVFDYDTKYLKSITVKKYAYLPKAPVGGVAVPTSVSVTNPNTSSAAISIGSTVNIDPVTGAGGSKIDIITSFGPAPSGGDTLITGTVSTFNGWIDV